VACAQDGGVAPLTAVAWQILAYVDRAAETARNTTSAAAPLHVDITMSCYRWVSAAAKVRTLHPQISQ
jgi:hypothetical protein